MRINMEEDQIHGEIYTKKYTNKEIYTWKNI